MIGKRTMSFAMIHPLRVLGLLAALFLSGCAQIPLGQPSPSFAVVEKVRTKAIAPVAVGTFQLAQGLAPEIDKGLSVRGSTVSAPTEGSFSQYLRALLIADLTASGLYDARSTSLLVGSLTESALDVPMSTGMASLGARFTLTRQGVTVYDKELHVTDSWPSAFMGVEAIPDGINHYSSLYHSLILKLLLDPDYEKAHPIEPK